MRSKTNKNTATALLRNEFSFYANEKGLEKIFESIAEEGVTIIAFTITNMRNVYFVRMVAGPPGSNSSFANSVVRDALHSAGVRYHEKEVIQVIVAPAPGIARNIFQALTDVRLIASYSAVNSIILNVSDNQTALKLLRENNIIR